MISAVNVDSLNQVREIPVSSIGKLKWSCHYYYEAVMFMIVN